MIVDTRGMIRAEVLAALYNYAILSLYNVVYEKEGVAQANSLYSYSNAISDTVDEAVLKSSPAYYFGEVKFGEKVTLMLNVCLQDEDSFDASNFNKLYGADAVEIALKQLRAKIAAANKTAYKRTASSASMNGSTPRSSLFSRLSFSPSSSNSGSPATSRSQTPTTAYRPITPNRGFFRTSPSPATEKQNGNTVQMTELSLGASQTSVAADDQSMPAPKSKSAFKSIFRIGS